MWADKLARIGTMKSWDLKNVHELFNEKYFSTFQGLREYEEVEAYEYILSPKTASPACQESTWGRATFPKALAWHSLCSRALYH